MKNMITILAILSATSAFAQNGAAPAPGAAMTGAGKGNGPCKQVVQDCEAAGFVKGQAKEGTGLWRDCVDPLMQGKVNSKAKKALPTGANISSDVAACKAKRPNFGEKNPVE